jgi:hypothetical protein
MPTIFFLRKISLPITHRATPLVLALIAGFLSSATVAAQDSTVVLKADSTLVVETADGVDSAKMAFIAKRFNPQKALLFAAILPGAGQVYNKKYWRVPIVYGGFAFLGYYIDFYNQNHRKYRGELFEMLGTRATQSASGFTETQVRSLIDRYRRERDFFIVLTGLWYALQIIDAHVDAHLKEFEINPNLQVSIGPSFKQDMVIGRQTGLTLSFRF